MTWRIEAYDYGHGVQAYRIVYDLPDGVRIVAEGMNRQDAENIVAQHNEGGA